MIPVSGRFFAELVLMAISVMPLSARALGAPSASRQSSGATDSWLAPSSAATDKPESSAIAIKPEARAASLAWSIALPAKVVSVSSGSRIAKAPAASFMYVESGEETLGEVVGAIAARAGLGPARSWPADEAIAYWGRRTAVFSLGSNSRVRGRRATELGWAPRHRSITGWIAAEMV